MTAPSDRDEQAPRKPLYAPLSPSDPLAGTERRPGVVSEPHRGSQRLHGRAVLHVTVDAPDARHATRWAGYIRQHLHNEYGDQMRLQTAIELDDPDCGCHTAGSEPPRCEHCDCPNPVACPDAPDPDQPAARCCVCGGGPVVYRNYREQPFCQHCADCSCGEDPCVRTGVSDPAVSEEAGAGREVYRAAFQSLLPEGSWHLAGRLADIAAAIAAQHPTRP